MTTDKIEAKKEKNAGGYISAALEKHCLNGDAFVTTETLYRLCKNEKKDLPYSVFTEDFRQQVRDGELHVEGRHIYLDRIWRCEESAAHSLAKLFRLPPLPVAVLPEPLMAGDVTLTAEQCEAVRMGLSNRLSMILGGAGCGKSTLITALAEHTCDARRVVCAPTGKAARNITERTGLPARTVHSACGIRPDDDFYPPVQWRETEMVIVDEASMLSLELLAHLLCRAPDECRVVLLGDPNQLPSVGAGNVIEDLRRLGVPYTELTANHRQAEEAGALYRNVTEFKALHQGGELSTDGSFRMTETDDGDLAERVVKEAAGRYLAGESFQVLTTYNKSTNLSARALNTLIRNIVNPPAPDKPSIICGGARFYDGDRVMITKNDRERRCCNGDVGILHIQRIRREKRLKPQGHGKPKAPVEVDVVSFSVALPDGRQPFWGDVEAREALAYLTLAYVVTVHKSQGSQYDAVLMPISMQMQNMLSRNLFYTAISRAKKQVLLFGSSQAVDVAVQRTLPPRKSMLVSKTQMLMLRAA